MKFTGGPVLWEFQSGLVPLLDEARLILASLARARRGNYPASLVLPVCRSGKIGKNASVQLWRREVVPSCVSCGTRLSKCQEGNVGGAQGTSKHDGWTQY